ncbi:YlbG family protein [Chengkuizengella axinellae]|uniref:YlbG family protein n=1 Tax=Chengkuizengella axinellae TaxID=3064388 RepID=A0ABT9IVG2_9BACL|nr:YlbG family protein [Chengkuizengella sp. 2205SS18-9]MDP5273338.1 YlbG family protein [Chengkuizengella sp. 2205SS18-9]
MFTGRTGLIIWVKHIKALRLVERYGTIHYVSKKMKYVVLYVNETKVEQTIAQLNKLNFVINIERSYRREIKTDYDTNVPDKTRFYSI